MSLNKVMLIGNVGKDPEVRYLDNISNPNAGNTKVATFTLATTERYRDRNGELRENTEWHNIIAWRNNADVVERFVKKGTQLFIEGRLRTRSWTDQSGQKRYTTEITVDNLQLLGKKSDNPGAQQNDGQTNQRSPYPAPRATVPVPGPAATALDETAAQPETPEPEIGEEPSDDLPF